MKGNSAPTTQQYFLYTYQKGYDSDPIHIHFLHVARIHKPVLNYITIITNGEQDYYTFMHIQSKKNS